MKLGKSCRLKENKFFFGCSKQYKNEDLSEKQVQNYNDVRYNLNGNGTNVRISFKLSKYIQVLPRKVSSKAN